jgi:succinate dehydrogenase/fumarate reductase flavoprotein subunit
MDTDPFETAPSSHFFMGGVRVDSDWRTCVPGLYCIGEAAGGPHGANRISQNALSDILVSGVVAARAAAQEAREAKQIRVNPAEAQQLEHRICSLLEAREGTPPDQLRRALREAMWKRAGVIRSGESLREVLEEIDRLSALPVCLSDRGNCLNYEVMHAFENRALLLTAKAIALSALARTETRGAHYRDDYPQTEEAWLCNVVLFHDGQEGFTAETSPVVFSRMGKEDAQ